MESRRRSSMPASSSRSTATQSSSSRASCRAIVTVEENTVVGGFGAAVLELLADEEIDIPVRTLGVPDQHLGAGIASATA